MNLLHFSDDPAIKAFEPRPLRVPVDRGVEREWLNGPLVWASDAAHALLYLFPRDCPRIVVWPTSHTTARDQEEWFGATSRRAIAFIEDDWLERMKCAVLYRYAMPATTFEDIGEVGMWVSKRRVVPMGLRTLSDLRDELDASDVELRTMPRLTPLKKLWRTTLHASGIRTRNAQDWGPPSWTHSKPGRTVIV